MNITLDDGSSLKHLIKEGSTCVEDSGTRSSHEDNFVRRSEAWKYWQKRSFKVLYEHDKIRGEYFIII